MKKNILHIIAPLLFVPLFVSAQSQTYTAAQVAQHNTTSDCWIIISGNVYSVGGYISMHPGGKKALANQCGKDATTAFTTQGGNGSHSSSAHATLKTFLIGSIGQAPVPSTTQPTPVVVAPATTTTSTSTLTVNQKYTLCTQTAIRKRDTSLVSARSTYNSSMTVALDGRTVAETSAIAIGDDDERQAALVAAAIAYANQVKLSQDTLKNTRQSVLLAYDADIKKCKSDKQNNSVVSSKKRNDDSSSKERKEVETESHSSSKGTLKSIQDEYKKKVSDIKSFFKSEKSSDKSSEKSGKQENKRESNDD
jgi:cytochrome b involved in lipid metabolism